MADVSIEVRLDGIQQSLNGLSKLTSEMRSVGAQAQKTSAQTDLMGAGFNRLKSIALGFAFAATAREAIKLADAMTNMQSRIKLVVGSNEKAIATQQKLLDVANRTRTDFEAVGALYSRLGRSADALGISQERLIAFTETFSQALKISGASTGEAQSTILQLSQALASGRLQGAELNAILEAGGRAATALADGLGVPIGSLKKLGEQGELTAEKVIRAIESQAGVINSEFGGMQITVSDSITVLQNSFAEMIGKINSSTGATKSLSDQVLTLAKMIKDPQFIEGLTQVAAGIAAVANAALQAASFVGNLYTQLKTLGGYLPSIGPGFGDKLKFIADQGAPWKPSGQFAGTAIGGGWEEYVAPAAASPGTGKPKPKPAADPDAAKNAIKRLKMQLNELRDADADLQAIQEDMWSSAQSKIEDILTPIEQYRMELQDVEALYASGTGPLTFDQMSRVVDDMNRKLAESNQSVSAIEDAFGSAFEAAIDGAENFGDTLKDIGKSLAKDLFKANIFDPAKNSINSAIGGLLGGGKKDAGGDVMSMLSSGEGQDVTQGFLSQLSDIFGTGDKGFLGALGQMFNGDNGIIKMFSDVFTGAWDILSTLFTSFLTEQGILNAWTIAESWAIELWSTAERWAIAIFEAAAGFLGFETGGELTVTRPTLFVAGEKNKAERVSVSPLAGGSRGDRRSGSGTFSSVSGADMKGGATTNVQVFIPQTSVISGITEGSFARKITRAVGRQTARTV